MIVERHVPVSARLGEPIAQRVRSDRRGPFGVACEDVLVWLRLQASLPKRCTSRCHPAGEPGVGLVRKPTKESDWHDVPLIDSVRAAFERRLARRHEHTRRANSSRLRTLVSAVWLHSAYSATGPGYQLPLQTAVTWMFSVEVMRLCSNPSWSVDLGLCGTKA